MKKVTALDVAKACGVSQATVSYVLNNRPDKQISDKTREKVLAAASRLAYYPDAYAQGMRTRRAMSIGIVAGQDSINLSFHQALRGIKEILYRNGYSITLLPDDEPSDQAEYVAYFLSGRIDGILFLYLTLNEEAQGILNSNNIPYLTINETGIQGCGISVSTGLHTAIRECVLYCRDHQFSRVAYLSFARTVSNATVTRKFTLLKDLFAAEYPQAVLDEHLLARGYADDTLREEITTILQQERSQMIFTPLPRLTLLTQGCILQENFTLPQSIKLISLYDSHFFDTIYPSITHIGFSLGEMGRYACECLMDFLARREIVLRDFDCTLQWGMSTLAGGGGD